MDKDCQCSPSNSLQENLLACQECKRVHAKCLGLGYVPPDRILDNVWIGGIASSINEAELSKLGIDRVMIVMEKCCLNLFEPVEYLHVPVATEGGDIGPHLNNMADFIHEANTGVLIFDSGGSKRSGAGVAAYMIKYKDCSVEEARRHIEKQRSCVFFPRNYKAKLADFFNSLKAVKKSPIKKKAANSKEKKAKILKRSKQITDANKDDIKAQGIESHEKEDKPEEFPASSKKRLCPPKHTVLRCIMQ
eukprot:TRINITY_DN1241_c0_g1_i15.p1 TRINITY_DN1241_c0_g1~~TRINITY_DN1241_c0_g1_i15.p1  ORF type:complete len:248 (+),score=66.01 TRINITY_DN1241_c0_g1_i15:1160-1903(+)